MRAWQTFPEPPIRFYSPCDSSVSVIPVTDRTRMLRGYIWKEDGRWTGSTVTRGSSAPVRIGQHRSRKDALEALSLTGDA